MSDKYVEELAAQYGEDDIWSERMRNAIREAVQHEREECAKEAMAFVHGMLGSITPYDGRNTATKIAARIRARGVSE